MNENIVYVSGDNSGDFNVTEDTKTKAQVIINEAINYVKNNPEYTTVCLKGPFEYIISDTIICCSNLELFGEQAIVKLIDNANWAINKPLIGPIETKLGNVKLHDFEINGNYEGNKNVNHGSGFYDLIHFDNSDKIDIYSMKIHGGANDGVKIVNSTNVTFTGNDVTDLGHDTVSFIRSDNCHSFGNVIESNINSAGRLIDCTNSSIHDNEIHGGVNSGAGIQIERQYRPAINVEVYNNVVHDTAGAGIFVVAPNAVKENGKSKITIYDNIVYNAGKSENAEWVGGIVVFNQHGTYIESNTIDNCHNAGICYMGISDGTESSINVNSCVKNNIIVNTQKRIYKSEDTGYGICSRLSSHKLSITSNCLFNNVSGNYKNVVSKNDIFEDPLFGNSEKHDYKLKSKAGRWNGTEWIVDEVHSPCIDTGYSGSSYINEPSANNNRINIGAYGNTYYASKSIAGQTQADEAVDELEDIRQTVKKTVTLYPTFNNRLKKSSPETILKTHTFADIGSLGSDIFRDLVYFDLRKYNNLKITKATLHMFWYYPNGKTRTKDTIVELYRPDSYTAAYASWNKRNKNVKWKNIGGDWYDIEGKTNGTAPCASLTFPAKTVPTNKYYTMDVCELVQKYTNGTFSNTGFLLKAKSEKDNYIAFYSGLIAQTNKKMKLIIEYEDYENTYDSNK